MMFTLKMAGLIIAVDNKYPSVERQCRDYAVEREAGECDMRVCVSEDEIDREMEAALTPVSRGYAESICIYRNICLQLAGYDAFLMHAAVVEVDGDGYAFAAKSGTGKTTHVTLWKKLFGNRANIVNGDKPIIRFHDGVPYAYGTPWCGKERENINSRVPLKALCFIERAKQNSIAPLEGQQMLARLFGQLLLPCDAGEVVRLTALLDRLVRGVPCYLLKCNMDVEAAEVAYKGMCGGGV